MIQYEKYEKAIYDWLMLKNKNSGFTFSLRQTANKGAQKDYFIGTFKSNYIATTFWTIPVSFPGSAGDVIQLVFHYTKNKKELGYYFECKQTKKPENAQNQYALELIQSLEAPLEKKFGFTKPIKPNSKIYNYRVKPIEPSYGNIDFMLNDIDKQLKEFIDIVNKYIEVLKEKHKDFKADQISEKEFQASLEKAHKRIQKYKTFEDPKEVVLLDTSVHVKDKDSKVSPSLNQILYGPPGTGKTYHTINKAISIINPSFDLNQTRELVKAEYKRLVHAGQIVFTTFHQSLSYEDFVEGIKPLIDEDAEGNKQVIYDVQPGVFKQLVDHMLISRMDSIDEAVYTFDDGWNELITLANQQIEKEQEYKLNILTPEMGMFVTEITSNGNLNLRPSKGAGKQYLVSYSRAKKLQQAFPNLSFVKNIDKEFREVIGGMNSTAYWSVLNFINNKISSKTDKSRKKISKNNLPHVLIIDEINRGNVSAIFGELITLIEDSKREGKVESLDVILPYSKEKFIIPSNLYIIGTMNTADRSVEALDTALRRRFVFEEMLPDYTLKEIQYKLFDYTAADILKRINHRIEKLIDQGHSIGHAYFIGKDEDTIIESFYKNIIPLLQEYFFGDYGKIGLVLGKGFVRKKPIEADLFADFEYDYKSELEERPVYEIIDYRVSSPGSGTFEGAINHLMSYGG